MHAEPLQRHHTLLIIAAASLLMVTMGGRLSMGLFVSPINSATGMGITAISFALAVAQFVWGAAQPIAGAFADRYGPGRVLAAGSVIMALGFALTPWMSDMWGMTFSLGLLMAAGSGAGSFSVLIGAASQRLPASRRGPASGIINAGGSFGQFIFAPILQYLIGVIGWIGSLYALALASLATLPLARLLRHQDEPGHSATSAHAQATQPQQTLKAALREAMQDRSYLLLHAGFFTCGFHIAFLVTHLPGEVQLCGLPPQVASWSLAIIGLSNIFGSLFAGWCVQRYRSKYVLFWMYASRAVLVALYLMAPASEFTFYVFAIGLGFTWLATVPPTAGVVSKLFGLRYLGTLFGMTLLTHQIGGFLGAWLGGLAFVSNGDYMWMWYADMALASLAAVFNLPIREARITPHPAAA